MSEAAKIIELTTKEKAKKAVTEDINPALWGAIMVLNPINPVNWVIYLVSFLVFAFAILPKKEGKRQLKLAALLALIPYVILSFLFNYVAAVVGIKAFSLLQFF